jgi:hypothetical protein
VKRPKKSKSGPAAVHSPTPRKAGNFLGPAGSAKKADAIDLLTSEDDGEIEVTVKIATFYERDNQCDSIISGCFVE